MIEMHLVVNRSQIHAALCWLQRKQIRSFFIFTPSVLQQYKITEVDY
jgi:hypothetical protein